MENSNFIDLLIFLTKSSSDIFTSINWVNLSIILDNSSLKSILGDESNPKQCKGGYNRLCKKFWKRP